MCDASDFDVGDVLGQWVDKKLNVIHYASKTLHATQKNYATTEKDFLAIVFACDKFRTYIVDSKVTIHTDHAATPSVRNYPAFCVWSKSNFSNFDQTYW
jgi:hypothetical protein